MNDSSFQKYMVHQGYSRGFLGEGRQTTVGCRRTAYMPVSIISQKGIQRTRCDMCYLVLRWYVHWYVPPVNTAVGPIDISWSMVGAPRVYVYVWFYLQFCRLCFNTVIKSYECFPSPMTLVTQTDSLAAALPKTYKCYLQLVGHSRRHRPVERALEMSDVR